jgi:hypothetical protein
LAAAAEVKDLADPQDRAHRINNSARREVEQTPD